MAKEFVKLGYYLGIGGVVTFKILKTLKKLLKKFHLKRNDSRDGLPIFNARTFQRKEE